MPDKSSEKDNINISDISGGETQVGPIVTGKVGRDVVGGDKVEGDKVSGDKTVNIYQQTNSHQLKIDVIRELNKLLFYLCQDLLVLVKNFNQPDIILSSLETTDGEKLGYGNSLKSRADFYIYFNENRIFIPKCTCKKVDVLYKNLSEIENLYIQKTLTDQGITFLDNEARNLKDKASNIFEIEIPQLQKELEQEFRKLLGEKKQEI